MAHTMDETLMAVAAAMSLGEAIVDEAIEIPSEYAGLAATVIARSAQSIRSVSHLAQLGLNGDAMSVARTIVELAIDIAYIATDPEKLVPMFVDYARVREWQLVQAVDRLHGGTVSPDAMRVIRERHDEYLAQNPDSDHNWAGHGLRWRAERVFGNEKTKRQHVQMYELLYADMCGASHSGYTTLKYTLVGDPNRPTLHYGPMQPEVRPVALGFVAMLQLLKTVIDSLKLESLDARLMQLDQMLGPPVPAS